MLLGIVSYRVFPALIVDILISLACFPSPRTVLLPAVPLWRVFGLCHILWSS